MPFHVYRGAQGRNVASTDDDPASFVLVATGRQLDRREVALLAECSIHVYLIASFSELFESRQY